MSRVGRALRVRTGQGDWRWIRLTYFPTGNPGGRLRQAAVLLSLPPFDLIVQIPARRDEDGDGEGLVFAHRVPDVGRGLLGSVDEEDALVFLCEAVGGVERERGLAGAALLVEESGYGYSRGRDRFRGPTPLRSVRLAEVTFRRFSFSGMSALVVRRRASADSGFRRQPFRVDIISFLITTRNQPD